MPSGSEPKTFAIYTLGCKVNQYDSESLAHDLRGFGLRQVPFGESADAYIIDTCTVTAEADRKSRKAARRAVRLRPGAVVAVTGCGPTWEREQFASLEGVRLVTDNEGKGRLAAAVAEALEVDGPETTALDAVSLPSGQLQGTTSASPRVRAYLKVQDGCNRRCSYCIVPRVRGRERSKPVTEAVAEARSRVVEGFCELVVTGVRLGGYSDPAFPGQAGLIALLEQLSEIEGLARIRLSSIDPPDVTPPLIEALARLEPVCEHVHLPLQSGDDSVLRAMNRRYDVEQFLAVVAQLREAVPALGLTTDVMVGFPGETDAQFENTVRTCREAGFSRLHVFQYSRRPGTRASELPAQVPTAVKRQRSSRLIEAGAELAQSFAEKHLSQTVELLVEQCLDTHLAEGLTRNYVRTRAAAADARPGQLLSVRVERASGGVLHGTEVEETLGAP